MLPSIFQVVLQAWLITLTLPIVYSDCINSTVPNTYCLPKCCKSDESLLFWKIECTRSDNSTNSTPWQPPIYQSANQPHLKTNPLSKIVYQYTSLPKNCSPIIYDDGSFDSGNRRLSTSHVNHPTVNEIFHEKDHVKLVLPEKNGGKLEFVSFYHGNRKWQVESFENFCVERVYVKSDDSSMKTGDDNDFVVIYCPNEGPNGNDIIIEDRRWIPWTYAGISVLALLFLLATILVYVALWDKHNLHSLTILGYSISTFGSYFFLSMAHSISLLPDPEIAGLRDRGFFCYANASLAHFFYLSSYLWLTVMNFDLWRTFKVIRVVGKHDKEWLKFGAYSVFAFGLPALLVVIFVILDHVYRDPLTEVPVPDYAFGSCFVSPEFRGQYVYTPMAILLVLNIILIGMTMWIFIQARHHTSKTFNSGCVSNAKQYNAQLFARLFILMGGTSIVNFLTWYYNNKGYKPWLVVGLETISYFTPVVLFFLFCWNEKILNHLKEKYPRVAEKVRPVLRIFKKDENSSVVISTANNSPDATYKTGLSSSLDRMDGSQNVKPLRSFEKL